MSENRFKFDGLEELKEALRTLPADLTAEASHIVEASANGAEATIKGGYPVLTGELRDGLSLTLNTSGFVARAVIKNVSPIAWLFDNGSQARHKDSGSSTGQMWGKTPPTHLFVATCIRARQQMYEQLKDLLERHGLIVSGEADV